MSDKMNSLPKTSDQQSQCLQSGQNRPQQQQDPQSQCPLSPCSYSPCSPESGGEIPCPQQQCSQPHSPPAETQSPQQQNSPASNLQSQITGEQYSLHQCPVQQCSQSQSPQPQCPHSSSSSSPCSPASRVQSPCPPQQSPQQNSPASDLQSHITAEQYSLPQCPLLPCSLQSPLQPHCPNSPSSYSPCSPASRAQSPCPPTQWPQPQSPQQNSPASNLQAQITGEQYSLHKCPLQPCSLQSPPQPQCPHSSSSSSPCSPESRAQSPCPPQQWPPPQSPPKSPPQNSQEQNAPANNSQSQILPEQHSLNQCPLQPCSHQCPPQPQLQCPSSLCSHSQCPPASWGPHVTIITQSCPPQPCPPQNNPPIHSPQKQGSLECNPQQQCPPQQWPPIQKPQTQYPPKPCSQQQYPSEPQYPQTLCSPPECLSRQGCQEQWPQEECPHQQLPLPQSPPQPNPIPPSSLPQSSLPSESPEIPPKPSSPPSDRQCSGLANEKHGADAETENPPERNDKPKMTYDCPVSRGKQKFQTPYKGWGSFDKKVIDESDKPVPSLQVTPAQVSLPGLLKSSQSYKAEPLLPPKVISSKKKSKSCPPDTASNVMTPHQKTRATLKCAMKDLICHAITKTQDAVTAISNESIMQFQKLKKSLSSSNCEIDGKPKKVSNNHSETSLRTFGVVNLANGPCKSEKEKGASEGQSESDPVKFLIDKVDSVVSLMSEKLGVEIQNPLKGPWRSYNDDSSKYDVPKPPPPKPKKVENILNPTSNLNLLSSIKEKIWSMFADDDKPSELSKKSSTTTVSSENDEDDRAE